MRQNYPISLPPNDYSNPNATASKFEEIENRLDEIEHGSEAEKDHDSRSIGIWIFGSALAMVLSWSRNASILYCIGHGIVSWIYVVYFALTRK